MNAKYNMYKLVILLYLILHSLRFQTEKRFTASVLSEKGALPTGWLLLEETQGWQNNARGSHEAKSARNGGNVPGEGGVVVIVKYCT